jgi:hypothetical protein
MVTREDWLEQLKKCLSILTPINKYLVKFQKDSVPLSDVYQCFESLPFEFEENQYLSHVDKAYLKKLVMDRWNFCYSDAHGVAYLLDPRFTGSRMDLDLKEKVLEFVCELSQVSGEELQEEKNDAVVMEYDNFYKYCEGQRQKPVKGRFWNLLMSVEFRRTFEDSNEHRTNANANTNLCSFEEFEEFEKLLLDFYAL